MPRSLLEPSEGVAGDGGGGGGGGLGDASLTAGVGAATSTARQPPRKSPWVGSGCGGTGGDRGPPPPSGGAAEDAGASVVVAEDNRTGMEMLSDHVGGGVGVPRLVSSLAVVVWWLCGAPC